MANCCATYFLEKSFWYCVTVRRKFCRWIPAQFDKSSLIAQWVANDPSYFHADRDDPDLILCWGHMPFYWFCREAAQVFIDTPVNFRILFNNSILFNDQINVYVFLELNKPISLVCFSMKVYFLHSGGSEPMTEFLISKQTPKIQAVSFCFC